ncbi:fibronectin type III domain-containing protein [Catellatospora sp. NPDC049133]|uniref:fibronectin type III domain-containing protein n=1 Tax=Catellatospora sp. NPDC049133 TaxID=3155499 RepID=UPI0033E4A696
MALLGGCGAALVSQPALAATTITKIVTGGLAGDNEFSVSAQVSDDGNVVVFRSNDPTLVAPVNANGYRPSQLFLWRRGSTTVEQLTVSAAGVKADRMVTEYSLSGDGRYVVFAGYATNLGPGCVGNAPCVFRKDLLTGAVITASPGLFNGTPGSPGVFANMPSISGNGRFALYRSSALADVVLSDLTTGTTKPLPRTSLTGDVPMSTLMVAGAESYHPTRQTVTDDGRHVLASGWDTSTNIRFDLYLIDTATRVSKRITRALDGGPANGSSTGVQITPDGSKVLFTSSATNLTADGVRGVFVHDVATATTTLVSVGADGLQQANSTGQSISDDGRHVFFSDPMTVRDLVTGVSRRITDHGSMGPFIGLQGNFHVSGDGSTIVGAGTTGSQIDNNYANSGVWVFDGYTAPAVDHTPPVLTGTPDRAPDKAGWYRAPVTITWSSSDPSPSAGAPNIPAPTAVSTQGADQVVTATSCDPAGNCDTAHVTVSIDTGLPAVTIAGVTAGATYERGAVPVPTCSAADDLSGLAAACTVTVSGGNPDGSGTFTVTAYADDIAGNRGEASAAYTVEALDVPATPLLASLVMGDHSATVTWLKPDDGGSLILGYTATAAPGGRTCATDSADELTCTITGLPNGVNYTFTVTASNAVGNSPTPPSGGGTGPGTPTGSGTPGTPPGPVPGVQPTPDSEDGTRVTLRWLAAASELPIIGYRATAEPGGHFCTTDGALSCTITGLTDGVDHTFTVVAINGIGSSDPSQPVGLPPAVTALTPEHGPSLGGITITISGVHLSGATAVMFGDTPATSFTVQGDDILTAVAPPHEPGAVDVRVSTAAGTSPIAATGRFTYEPVADVAVTASASTHSPALGDVFTETVIVRNAGPDRTTQTTATVTIHGAAATVLAATTTAGTCQVVAAAVTCELGVLPSGGSVVMAVTVEPGAESEMTVTATANGLEADPAVSDNTAAHTVAVTNAHGCTVIGTAGDDTIAGTNARDVICSLGGDDRIFAGNGDDVVYGGTGADVLDGGNGDDILYAGPTGSMLIGGNGNDTLIGGIGDDIIRGDNGNDLIDAGSGSDAIYGGNGNDAVAAGDGDDTVDGGSGNDTCADTEHRTSCTG